MKRSMLFGLMLLFGADPLYSQEIHMWSRLDSVDAGTSSPGRGTATMVLSSDRTTLRYQITVNNLLGAITAAHFHDAETGNPIETITFSGKSAVGTWTIPDSVFEPLISEGIYINVHTTSAGAGEIRGRVRPSQFGFPIVIDGAQAGTSSPGTGTGYVRFEDSSGVFALRWQITYGGLQGTRTNAHFHQSPDGAVQRAIVFSDSTSEEEWVNPPDSFLVKLFRGKLYVNIHSSVAGSGEIRGAVGFVGEIPSLGSLDGQQAGTVATGRGTAWAVLRSDGSINYSATVTGLTGPVTASHFHTSRTGSPVHTVTMTNGHATSVWQSPADQDIADHILNRLYLNVHTTANGSGEIRANMSSNNGGVMGVMDGAQASTSSAGKGTVWVRFDDDSVYYDATYAGLEGAYSNAHFHISPGGGVVFPTPFTAGHAQGWWTPESLWIDLVQGDIYMNVHSSTQTSGEIRANLKLGTGLATSVPTGGVVAPAAYSLAQNYPNPFNPTTTIAFVIPEKAHISLRVFNVLGQTVARLVDEVRPAGAYTAVLNAGRLSTGVYFYSLIVDGNTLATRRMILLK